jgi:hypothetical protein
VLGDHLDAETKASLRELARRVGRAERTLQRLKEYRARSSPTGLHNHCRITAAQSLWYLWGAQRVEAIVSNTIVRNLAPSQAGNTAGDRAQKIYSEMTQKMIAAATDKAKSAMSTHRDYD